MALSIESMQKKLSTLLTLLAAAALCGCASSTVEKRKQERATAYSSLAPEARSLVDQGQIKVGMSADAVYIAWGKPSQILTSESADGRIISWLYHGTQLESHSYRSYRQVYHGGRCWTEPYLDHDYYPRSYVRAQIVFQNDLVKEWHSLPAPVY